MKYKVSLHSHILGVKAKESDIRLFLDSAFQNTKQGESTVIGIASFNAQGGYALAQKYILQHAAEYSFSGTRKDIILLLRKENKILYVVKTDEQATDNGHILVVGYPKSLQGATVREVIHKAKQYKCPIIINHPLHGFACSMYRKFSASERVIREYQSLVDAIECNAYFPEDWNKINTLAKKINLPVVTDSDAHYNDELLCSFWETEILNMETPESFRASVKLALRAQPRLQYFAHKRYKMYRHACVAVFGRFFSFLKLSGKLDRVIQD